MNNKIKTEAVDQLFDAFLKLETREECYNFFEDLCTVNELLALSQRFAVAKMLEEKKTYLEIAEKTGASTATISRVNHSLNYGSDGYELIFKRIKEENGRFKSAADFHHIHGIDIFIIIHNLISPMGCYKIHFKEELTL